MKKILYFAALISVLGSCKQREHGAFTVSGEFEHAAGRKLLLMETPFGNAPEVVLDSTMLNDKGSFTLKGKATEEGVFRLMVENGPNVILINDNNAIKVRLDVNDYRNYKIDGSPASESLHSLFEDYRAKDSAILVTFKKIDSVKNTPGQDSVAEMLQSQNDLQITALNNMLKEYVTSSVSPSAALYALGIASQTIPHDELVAIVSATAKKFPENAAFARVQSMLAAKAAEPETPKAFELLNKQAPDLTMDGLNGKPVSISSFRGKYLLVDFWASWCGPCRQENPNVVAAYNMFKNKNFTILGVSLDQDKAAWEKAIAKDGLTWTQMSDLKQWESAAVEPYGIQGIPFNVLIDPAGKIIASSLRGEELEKKLGEVLK